MVESRQSRRLLTILAEVVSVVFAVLVALAVDEWWEDREEVRMAERSLEVVAREIRENRAELLDDGGTGAADPTGAGLDSAIAAFRAGREPSEVKVHWSVALLSSAAWETAQLTGTVGRMPLDLVVDLAQLYEFQRFYSRSQDQLTATIADIGARIEAEPVPVLLELRSRYAATSELRATLATLYACTLVRLEGPGVDEAGECPEPPAG